MPRQQTLTDNEFQRHYRLLGIARPQHHRRPVEWQEVQRAYRQLAQRYHPDKPGTGSAMQFRDLNAAFRDLKRYYGTFGLLPAIEPKQPLANGSESTAGKPAQPRADGIVPTSRRSWLLPLFVVLAIPPLAYLIWPRPSDRPISAELGILDSVESTSQAVEPWIAIGMTKAQVLAIHGDPMIRDQREWTYGVSKVFFTNGLVTGWFNARSTPLHRGPDAYGWVGADYRKRTR